MPNLSPEEQAELDALLKEHGAELTGEDALAAQKYQSGGIDPSLPPVPQALAMQPATTHPEGDEGAEQDWIRNPQGAAQGAVYMYEPPLNAARKALAENPSLVTYLMGDLYDPQRGGIPFGPEDAAGLTTDSPLYQAYADDLWRQSAEKAAAGGKTAYRYSRAPYLQAGVEGLDPLDTLGMKLKGAIPGLVGAGTSFIMGVDNAMTLGAWGRGMDAAAQRAPSPHQNMPTGGPDFPGPLALPPTQDPNAPTGTQAHPERDGDEFVGLSEPTRENALEEHPIAGVGGQVLATLAPWSAAHRAYQVASGAISPLAGAAPGVVRSAATSGAAGALGGYIEQGGREAVGVAVNAGNGQGAVADPNWENRMKIAAILGGGFGASADLLGSAAASTANWIGGPTGRYGGLPEDFEAAGGRMTSRGPEAPPQVQEVLERAEGQRLAPVDVKANDLRGTVEASTKAHGEAVNARVREATHAYFPTPEGQMKLPDTEVVKTALQTLREQHDKAGKVIGAGKNEANWTRDIFNQELSGVSVEPGNGAIEMSVDEADAFLAKPWKDELVEKVAPKDTRPSGGARELDLDAPAENTGEGFAATLRREGIDKVYVSPRRYTAEEHEQLKETFQTLKDSDDPAARDAQKLWHAALADRRARPMNGEEGAWSRMQEEHSKAIGAAKDEKKLVAPRGNAFKPLQQYAKEREGQLPRSNALRDATVRAGALGELEQLRVLGMLDQLQGLANLGRGHLGRSPVGPTALFDAGAMRSYAKLRELGNASTSPMRGGRGGLAGSLVGQPYDQLSKNPLRLTEEREGSDAQK